MSVPETDEEKKAIAEYKEDLKKAEELMEDPTLSEERKGRLQALIEFIKDSIAAIKGDAAVPELKKVKRQVKRKKRKSVKHQKRKRSQKIKKRKSVKRQVKKRSSLKKGKK